MPPRLKKYSAEEFWDVYQNLVDRDEPEEKSSETVLRDLVNPMRVRAGRNPQRFAALLNFLNSSKKKDLLDPAMLQTIRKLVQDFEHYLQQVKPLDQQVPADKILTAALNGLVIYRVLSKAEARTFCLTVLKTAVAQQWPTYTAIEAKVVLEQIAVLSKNDPESPILQKLQQVLNKRLSIQIKKHQTIEK